MVKKRRLRIRVVPPSIVVGTQETTIHRLVVARRLAHLRPPLKVTQTSDLWSFTIEDHHFLGLGRRLGPRGLVSAVENVLTFVWASYVMEEPERLTKDALDLRRALSRRLTFANKYAR